MFNKSSSFLILAALLASPAVASSSASSTISPADLQKCLTRSLGAAQMLVIVSPLADDGYVIEARPPLGGKRSTIVVNKSGDGATLLTSAPKSSPAPAAVDSAVKECAPR